MDLESFVAEMTTGREHSRADYLIEFLDYALAQRTKSPDYVTLDEIATALDAFHEAEERDQ